MEIGTGYTHASFIALLEVYWWIMKLEEESNGEKACLIGSSY